VILTGEPEASIMNSFGVPFAKSLLKVVAKILNGDFYTLD
jgi:hypothetical protein